MDDVKFELEFDTGKFIDEIKNRPAIWNCASVDYSNRELKRASWDEVVRLFGGTNLSPSKKRIMQITLRRKWKGLRGCFTRELKRQEDLRAGVDSGVRKSEYTHFKQMLFLRSVVTTKTRTSGNEEYAYFEEPKDRPDPNLSKVKQENSIEDDYHQVDDENSIDICEQELLDEASSEYSKIEEANEKFNENRDPLSLSRKKGLRFDSKTEDEDLLFLLSLLKTLQRVPFKKKMATKIKLMAVLDEATKDSENSENPMCI